MNDKSSLRHICKTCHNIFKNKMIENNCKKSILVPLTIHNNDEYNFILPCPTAKHWLEKPNNKVPKSVSHPH